MEIAHGDTRKSVAQSSEPDQFAHSRNPCGDRPPGRDLLCGGGLPASESFPDLALAEVPRSCLQYGATEGEPALRERIARDLQALGIECTAEQVLVLSGSQQGIDLVAKLMIDEGTPWRWRRPLIWQRCKSCGFWGSLRPAQYAPGGGS